MSLLLGEMYWHRRWLTRSEIGSPKIVTIWNGLFANYSRTLGWIWMKLGGWGWGLKRLSLARFQRNRATGFGESAKKWVAEVLFFCHVNRAPLLPLSLDRFLPNFPRTRVQVASRDIWFHIPEKFPLRGRISRKTVFLGHKRVPCLCPAYRSWETFCDAYTVSIPWWTSHGFILLGWLLLRDVLFSSYPRPNVLLCHGIGNGQLGIRGCGDSSAPGDRRNTNQ